MVAKASSPNTETLWHYQAADGEIYGPFNGQSMMEWVKSGYFKENLLIKTDSEENFHPLGEWSRLMGKIPFVFSNLRSFEEAVGLPNVQPPPPPMNPMQPSFFFPPGLAPPTTYPPPFRHPNGIPPYFPDPGMSRTPLEASMEANGYNNVPDMSEPRPPTMRSVSVETDRKVLKEQATQTLPQSISKEQATRLLTELFGQKVQIS